MAAAAKIVNLAVMFLLELATLLAAGYWGFTLDRPPAARVLAGLGAPVLLAGVWALFGAAADARFPLRGAARVLLEFAWFGSAVAAFTLAGRPGWGIAFGAVYLVNFALRVVWRQEPRLTGQPRHPAA